VGDWDIVPGEVTILGVLENVKILGEPANIENTV